MATRHLPRWAREKVGRLAASRVGVTLTPELEAPLFDDARERDVSGGWQAGKSTLGSLFVWCELPLLDLTREEPFRYWFNLPSYEDPAKEFDYLAAWAGRLGMVNRKSKPDGGPAVLELCNGHVIIETRTGRNVAAISGEACDGIVNVEAGQQAEAVRDQSQGRIMARDGWMANTGTLEDDENHARWAWYAEQCERYLNAPPGSEVRSFELPSWANPIYSGPTDPRIEALRRTLDPDTFARRVLGRSQGVANAVYRQLALKRDRLLRALPWALCVGCGGSGRDYETTARCRFCAGLGEVLPFTWIDSAGGIDYGSIHPSAVTAVTLASNGEAWVRACRFIADGDAGAIDQAKRDFAERYGIRRWGVDPNQRWAASLMSLQPGTVPDTADTIEAVRLGDGSRQGRIGLVTRRLNADRLLYDVHGEGVPELYEEQSRVHYRKAANGLLVMDRRKDDRTASLEDAIEVLDTADHALAIGRSIEEREVDPTQRKPEGRPVFMPEKAQRRAAEAPKGDGVRRGADYQQGGRR